ncbi:unnamed protein product, partial [Rangifer tarandus platyrhynchus]
MAASSTSAPPPLLDLKQTPAAAALQVIPTDAPPARAVVVLLRGCLSVLRSIRQVGLPCLMLGEGLTLGLGLMLD